MTSLQVSHILYNCYSCFFFNKNTTKESNFHCHKFAGSISKDGTKYQSVGEIYSSKRSSREERTSTKSSQCFLSKFKSIFIVLTDPILLIQCPNKNSFHHSGGIPVEFYWSHGKLLENYCNKWNLWNSSEILLEFQQFISITPLKFHL